MTEVEPGEESWDRRWADCDALLKLLGKMIEIMQARISQGMEIPRNVPIFIKGPGIDDGWMREIFAAFLITSQIKFILTFNHMK